MSLMRVAPAVETAPARERRQRHIRVVRPGPVRVRASVAPAVDVLALAVGSLLAASWFQGRWAPVILFDVAAVLFLRIGLRRRPFRRSPFDDVTSVFASTGIAAGCAITAQALFVDSPAAARQLVKIWLAVTAVVLVARLGLRAWSRAAEGGGAVKTLFIGADEGAERIARRLLDRSEAGLEPVAFVDVTGTAGRSLVGLPVVTAGAIEQTVWLNGIRNVVVTPSAASVPTVVDAVDRCRQLGLSLSLVPWLHEEVRASRHVEHLGGIPFVAADASAPAAWKLHAKDGIERSAAMVALVLLSPLMLLIAIGVRLGSRGPILYRQRRIGKKGREFDMLKFRTMYGSPERDGEADAAWVCEAIGEDVKTVERTRDRCTRIGLVLRRLSLDELPQLVNVVRGDMVLIGPRPERASLVRVFEDNLPGYADRHRVKGGMTGWAQVHGLRGETSLQDRVEWDNYYIDYWRPWLDLKVLLLTLPAMVRRRRSRSAGASAAAPPANTAG